jgi:1,4-dihydroxy-2-naphthoate octaprenyltransferase/chlorophyll synthase
VNVEALSVRDRWLYALKPGSWPKLLVAAGLGQAIGIAVDGEVHPFALVVGAIFTIFLLAFIVLLNDFGDQEVDALKRRLFPESCSPKTIPDGILEPRSVLWGGLGAGAASVATAAAAQLIFGRPGLTWGALMCTGIFVAYTFGPLKLNYRGGGEVLEMLGVGFALPWFHAYLQSGEIVPAGLVVLPAYALLCLASALASGLADEPSDRLGGKRTFATMFGTAPVRQAVDGLVLGGMIVWAMLPWLAPHYATVWMVVPALLLMGFDYRELRRVSSAPDVGTAHGLRTYKTHLHDCIWRGAAAVSVAVAVTGIIGGGLG